MSLDAYKSFDNAVLFIIKVFIFPRYDVQVHKYYCSMIFKHDDFKNYYNQIENYGDINMFFRKLWKWNAVAVYAFINEILNCTRKIV